MLVTYLVVLAYPHRLTASQEKLFLTSNGRKIHGILPSKILKGILKLNLVKAVFTTLLSALIRRLNLLAYLISPIGYVDCN